MRPKLSDLLTHRCPGLYEFPSCRPSELASGGVGFPFEHRDGWFGIIDALSEVLEWRAGIEGRPVPHAQQVKEKFGTLRFYFGNGDADDGAIDMAKEMTARLCESPGRPGRLGNRGGWWATRAPGMDGLQFARTATGKDGRMGVPCLAARSTKCGDGGPTCSLR